MAFAQESAISTDADLAARYGPVLSDLARGGVLEKDERGRWVVAGRAQSWLEMRTERPSTPTEVRMAVGLRCQLCGDSGLTTMADGRRLCMRCKVVDGYVDADPVPELRPRRAT
jgi:hypothetical protein